MKSLNKINSLLFSMALFFGASNFTQAQDKTASDIQISVDGTAYSSTNCGYYSTSLADLNFHFAGAPRGSRVVVRYGFHDALRGQDWASLNEQEMGVGTSSWDTSIKGVAVDIRGSSYYDSVEFVFHIFPSNKSDYFENGGSRTGYYSANLPRRVCQSGNFQNLPISIIKK